jgi:UMF1 family MFS transporter
MTVPTTEDTADVPETQYADRRERVGWYFYDWANSAFSTTVVTVFLGPYLKSIAENAADSTGHVHTLGLSIRPGSVFSYAVSLSVLLQVVVLPVVGAIADRSSHKRELLALFAYIGALATVAMVFLDGQRYWVGVVALVVANLAFGSSVVVYNSFLPQLARPDDRDKVSSIGWGIGYIGGGLLLLLNFIAALYFGDENKAEVARWSIVSAGVWWAVFTTLPLQRLKNRPAVAGQHRGSVLTDGFRQLGHTLVSLRAFPLTLLFLAAFLIYNDGIQTVITQATVYADSYLDLEQSVQLETILMVQFLAFGGAVLLGKLARRFGAKKTVLGSLILWAVVLGVAYVLPVGEALPFMGLGLLLGFVLGGSQALSRSLFSQLIPHGKEAEYFGLYEISDKGTSWMGPLLFGLVYDITGTYQWAIVSLLVFFVVGFIMLALVPMRRAIIAAGNEPPAVL